MILRLAAFILLTVVLPRLSLGGEFTGVKGYVYFKDKQGVSFDPEKYFDPKAIQRRIRKGLPVCDSSDFPVSSKYLDQVKFLADSITLTSRWLNMAVVYAQEENFPLIASLDCVKKIDFPTKAYPLLMQVSDDTAATDKYSMALLKYQTDRLQGFLFHQHKITGKGVRIAIFDAGFSNVNKNPVFKHLFRNKQIVGTYDFVGRDTQVYAHSFHGCAVLACIAGIKDSIPVGLAPGAQFLLARTERNFNEFLNEEENWLAATEWADKHGADIINSSLGYTYHRYFPEDMTGKRTLVAKAALIAIKKGILVVNSAGNEGSNSWKYIGSPADVDSVLAVGGTDPKTDLATKFSSSGPNAKFVLKPNVCAPGIVYSAGGKDMTTVSGTSFSSPLVAGFAACVMEGNPELTNTAVFRKIERSSHLWPYFDYSHGYGIPLAGKILFPETVSTPTFTISEDDIYLTIKLHENFCDEKGDTVIPRNLFYHIEATNGRLRKYQVIRPKCPEALRLKKSQFIREETLRIHFEGFTFERKF